MTCLHPVSTPLGLFPCGKCIPCRIQRQSVWTLRALHESETSGSSSVITLTYDDEHLQDGLLHYEDFKNFIRSVRKRHRKSVSYIACGEYGDTFHRPHFHACLFGIGPISLHRLNPWDKGFIKIDRFDRKCSDYTVKYLSKDGLLDWSSYDRANRPRLIISPGLGYDWFMQHYDFILNHGYILYNGKKWQLPNYYFFKMIQSLNDGETRLVEDWSDEALAFKRKCLEFSSREIGHRFDDLIRKYNYPFQDMQRYVADCDDGVVRHFKSNGLISVSDGNKLSLLKLAARVQSHSALIEYLHKKQLHGSKDLN